MARFRRLTDAEARTLTRREILDRVEAEQAYWHRGHRDRKDPEGYREFTAIMNAFLSPAAVGEAMQDTIDWIEGRPGAGGYWDRRPGEKAAALPPMDDSQRAGLDYARRVFGIGSGDARAAQEGGPW